MIELITQSIPIKAPAIRIKMKHYIEQVFDSNFKFYCDWIEKCEQLYLLWLLWC